MGKILTTLKNEGISLVIDSYVIPKVQEYVVDPVKNLSKDFYDWSNRTFEIEKYTTSVKSFIKENTGIDNLADVSCNLSKLDDVSDKLINEVSFFNTLVSDFNNLSGINDTALVKRISSYAGKASKNLTNINKLVKNYMQDREAFEQIASGKQTGGMTSKYSNLGSSMASVINSATVDETYVYDIGDRMEATDISGGKFNCGFDFSASSEDNKYTAKYALSYMGNKVKLWGCSFGYTINSIGTTWIGITEDFVDYFVGNIATLFSVFNYTNGVNMCNEIVSIDLEGFSNKLCKDYWSEQAGCDIDEYGIANLYGNIAGNIIFSEIVFSEFGSSGIGSSLKLNAYEGSSNLLKLASKFWNTFGPGILPGAIFGVKDAGNTYQADVATYGSDINWLKSYTNGKTKIIYNIAINWFEDWGINRVVKGDHPYITNLLNTVSNSLEIPGEYLIDYIYQFNEPNGIKNIYEYFDKHDVWTQTKNSIIIGLFTDLGTEMTLKSKQEDVDIKEVETKPELNEDVVAADKLVLTESFSNVKDAEGKTLRETYGVVQDQVAKDYLKYTEYNTNNFIDHYVDIASKNDIDTGIVDPATVTSKTRQILYENYDGEKFAYIDSLPAEMQNTIATYTVLKDVPKVKDTLASDFGLILSQYDNLTEFSVPLVATKKITVDGVTFEVELRGTDEQFLNKEYHALEEALKSNEIPDSTKYALKSVDKLIICDKSSLTLEGDLSYYGFTRDTNFVSGGVNKSYNDTVKNTEGDLIRFNGNTNVSEFIRIINHEAAHHIDYDYRTSFCHGYKQALIDDKLYQQNNLKSIGSFVEDYYGNIVYIDQNQRALQTSLSWGDETKTWLVPSNYAKSNNAENYAELRSYIYDSNSKIVNLYKNLFPNTSGIVVNNDNNYAAAWSTIKQREHTILDNSTFSIFD